MFKKSVNKDLELFLEDLKLDGANLKNLPCDSETHKREQCDSCKFFDSCPIPKKNL